MCWRRRVHGDSANIGRVDSAIERANTFRSIICFDSFEWTFGVHFEVVDWVTWDSRDDVHDPTAMAWEVWNETGFYTGMVVNGQYVDMLCACTGQDIEGYLAVTYPNANITLIETDYARNFGVIRHEFSHQFYCPECKKVCVMKQSHCIDPLIPTRDWCPNCEAIINSNKFKFTVVGDVDGNYIVTGEDVEHASSRLGSVKGDADWAPSCDINGDGLIDTDDISVISSNLGKYRYPPACTMKTRTDGYFYVPNVATDLLKVELLFDDSGIEGDQTGYDSPYPDGCVDGSDAWLLNFHWMTIEGSENWDYMADTVPDGIIEGLDLFVLLQNWGNTGIYSTDLTGVVIVFNTGEKIKPDSYGYVTIPQDATSFTVKQDGNPIGAMIIFW